MSDILLLLAGFALLLVGGELLVRGSVRVAELLGMSPLLIGLTLVGFGTSAPELVTSVEASLAGSPGIAVGNIVGSNIANILLILGTAAVLSPVAVSPSAFSRDGAFVVMTAILFVLIGTYWTLDRVVGGVFLVLLVGYMWNAYLQERTADDGRSAAKARVDAFDEVHPAATASVKGAGAAWSARDGITALIMALAGLALVIGGGKVLVEAATALARQSGISETVIGLTIVAIGTSMPELVTSIVASLRKHSDVALGNVLGSNIYNTLGIGGATALISPTAVPAEILRFDNLVMLGASVALLVFARTGYRLSRIEGLALLASYFGYLYMLWPK